MPKQRKTKEEKARSEYRLQNFRLQAVERVVAKDAHEFSYLSSEYVVRDLTKTAIFTAVIVTFLFLAKKYLG